MKKLPELLCPAGSPDALDAAIEGGADAVYFGGASFNARMNAKNFGGDALRSAVLRAHAYGVKTYLTLNTLLTDRELPAFVDAAEEAVRAGVDAVIVADLGGAMAIRRALPSLELHASTQMSGHNAQMGQLLQKIGFSRMVIARETSLADLSEIVQNSPIEIEYFIHGALCVSHSGQCLFSSLVGGRSGNRGECAQPCRLPYACADCNARGAKEGYPLSLKDLSLAAHVPELIESGVASLKIEGRMKSPEYVRDTARIWRRLLDEGRAATPKEMQSLAQSFSRNGFTDAYFLGKPDKSMLGIRSDADKSNSRAVEAFTGLTRKIPLTLHATVRTGEPISLTLSDGMREVTVCGDVPQAALTAPLDAATVERSLTKFGGTVFSVGSFSLSMDKGLMLPISRLNDLRRRALLAWENEKAPSASTSETTEKAQFSLHVPQKTRQTLRTAAFRSLEQITSDARAFFDRIYLPLDQHVKGVEGIVMPPVIFDHERESVERALLDAVRSGATHALVGNLGHVDMVKNAGLTPVGDFRLNVTNRESVVMLETLGIEESILSPELTLPQMRDVGGNTAAIVYGRIPLMLLEKCAIREIADCQRCATDSVRIKDRRGVEFPILRERDHRNVIYNSLPTGMSDRRDALSRHRIIAQHFLFTTENARQVDAILSAYRTASPLPYPVRRIKE